MLSGMIMGPMMMGRHVAEPARSAPDEIRALADARAILEIGRDEHALEVGDFVMRIGADGTPTTGDVLVVVRKISRTTGRTSIMSGEILLEEMDPARFASGAFLDPVIDIVLMGVSESGVISHQSGWSRAFRKVDPAVIAAALEGHEPNAFPGHVTPPAPPKSAGPGEPADPETILAGIAPRAEGAPAGPWSRE